MSIIKKILIWIGILGVAVAADLNNDLTKNEVNLEKLTAKYNASQEIKAKYQQDGVSLKTTPKDDPRDRIEVEIGDKDDIEFTPSLKIMRWDNEVSFKIKPKALDSVTTKDKDLKFDGDKIKFETPKVDYHLYELTEGEGGFEYEVILKEKPDTNVIEFALDTQGLDFFYQPELSQQEIDEGASRPENVVGSYAVYASEQKTNWVGGKEYKVGKVGHIFRPKIIDSAGTEVWGDLHIENGILSVTIPQDFLDKAVYPVRHAAGLSIGYETQGASTRSYLTRNSYRFTMGVSDGTATTVTGNRLQGTTSETNYFKFAIYLQSTGALLKVTDEGSKYGSGYSVITKNLTSSQALTAETDYILSLWGGTYSGNCNYDAGTANYGSATTAAYGGTFPDTLTDTFNVNYKYSIYATYTASDTPTTGSSPVIFRSNIIFRNNIIFR